MIRRTITVAVTLVLVLMVRLWSGLRLTRVRVRFTLLAMVTDQVRELF